jgi:hypothetical protein
MGQDTVGTRRQTLACQFGAKGRVIKGMELKDISAMERHRLRSAADCVIMMVGNFVMRNPLTASRFSPGASSESMPSRRDRH